MIKINILKFLMIMIVLCGTISCSQEQNNNSKEEETEKKELTAADILGNPDYLAISFGGYREKSRDIQPTVEQLKEDMKILNAMGVKLLRTYNVHLPQAETLLKAVRELKQEDSTFEMYVMLGAWIDCENAWTPTPNHYAENVERNTQEIAEAVRLTNEYPDIVKIIAVGNEAMVKWAASYHVQADIILKWVNHLQELKQTDKLPKDTWITSSDNFAAWGGGDPAEYHKEALEELIKAVDFVSLHIYPMHETHYHPEFWGVFDGEEALSDEEKINIAMKRALDYGKMQYEKAAEYIKSIDAGKTIHIGETGWASSSNGFYGDDGTKATDEYKEGIYYQLMRDWTNKEGMSCFYFEAFNENWKDQDNPGGSENYFGLFTIDGQAKYALWDLVDAGTFEGLGRNGKPIGKTYNGDKAALLKEVKLPPRKSANSK